MPKSKIHLLKGDCLEEMKRIKEDLIDLVLVDLPYGTTQCKWDSVIPFEPMWQQVNRVCKKNAAMVFTAAQPFTSKLVCSNIKNFKYDWVWQKPKGTGHLNAKKQPMRDKEDVVVFYRKQCNYKPQKISGKPYKAKPGKSKLNGEDCYGNYQDKRVDNTGTRYPKQVIQFPIQERDKVHPTQKPVALMEYLIKTYSNEGETVLDFTMGSGTTGVACKNLNRNFIGIEQDESYFSTAKERIENA